MVEKSDGIELDSTSLAPAKPNLPTSRSSLRDDAAIFETFHFVYRFRGREDCVCHAA